MSELKLKVKPTAHEMNFFTLLAQEGKSGGGGGGGGRSTNRVTKARPARSFKKTKVELKHDGNDNEGDVLDENQEHAAPPAAKKRRGSVMATVEHEGNADADAGDDEAAAAQLQFEASQSRWGGGKR